LGEGRKGNQEKAMRKTLLSAAGRKEEVVARKLG